VLRPDTAQVDPDATETERTARRVKFKEEGATTPVTASDPTPLEDRISDALRRSGKI